jgi:hypothetical protein
MMALVHLQAMSLAGSYYYTPVSVTVKPPMLSPHVGRFSAQEILLKDS